MGLPAGTLPVCMHTTSTFSYCLFLACTEYSVLQRLGIFLTEPVAQLMMGLPSTSEEAPPDTHQAHDQAFPPGFDRFSHQSFDRLLTGWWRRRPQSIAPGQVLLTLVDFVTPRHICAFFAVASREREREKNQSGLFCPGAKQRLGWLGAAGSVPEVRLRDWAGHVRG